MALGHLLPVGDLHMARRIGESDVDFAIIDMEHEGFDFVGLGNTLQWLLSRRRMLHEASVLPAPTPLVRIPTNANEADQWVTKQTLDYGPFGLVVPHLRTAEEAESIVRAVRYPQTPDSDIPEPNGHRGFWPGLAWRYWGANSFADYYHRADVWPLNPRGEMIIMGILEEVTAWENVEEILRVPGIGALWFGPGDGSVSIGNLSRDFDDPRLAEYRQHVLRCCQEAGVPVGTSGKRPDQWKELIRQGFHFINTSGPDPEGFALEALPLTGRELSSWSSQPFPN